MAFAAGARVRLVNNPSMVGRATGAVILRGLREIVEVEFEGRGTEHYPAEALETCAERPSHQQDFAQGRFSGPSDLSAVITLEKLRGDLTDLIYSMGSGKTEFHPHQFKPVLKFVQANVGRILIADEVGLGKTIEAIYLWKELQVRDQARRLLVVCPKMLRHKWRRELDYWFGIDAREVDARGLLEALQRADRNPSTSFALVTGLEGCRPPARFREASGVRAELAQLLDASPASEEAGLIDLTVIDEAHYLRNPETRSNKLGGLLRDASRRLALLTATPIQINSDNLYQLLTLVDPEDYPNAYEFDIRRRANEPIVAAATAFRRRPLDRKDAAATLDRCLAQSLFAKDDTLRALRDRLAGGAKFDPEDQVEAAQMLEERSLLGRHMTRSRKRDVLKDRVERDAQPLKIHFHPLEKAAYERVTAVIRQRSLENWSGHLTGATLGLITRQRQMASSLPAALGAWLEQGLLEEQVWDDLGGLAEDADGGSAAAIVVAAPEGLSVADLEAVDTKYAAFLDAVRKALATPGTKIVTFAFFRATLRYLARRLAVDEIETILLTGGMVDQQDRLDAFAAPGGPSILLSSEVAAEGIDLQFARVLVNYDLPWNPMRVEQRIGRLDRLGQEAERIGIISLFVQDTIEERILERLYDRIGIFKESIGDLEPILGEISEQLLIDVMDPTLSDAERRLKADQTLMAIADRVRTTRILEDEAQHLLGLNDFLLGQIDAKREDGDWIRPEEVRRFITDALQRGFPSSRLEAQPEDPDYFSLQLCGPARASLQEFLDQEDPGGRARALLGPRTLFLSNAAKLKSRKGNIELIDAGHLLVRWLRRALQIEGLEPHSVCASRAASKETGLAPGLYVFAVQARKLVGIRREAAMETCAFRLGADEPLPWAQGAVVRRAAETGLPYSPRGEEIDGALPFAEEAAGLLIDRAMERRQAFELENERLCDQREAAARAFRDRRVAELNATIADVSGDPSRARIIPALNERIRNQDDELTTKLERVARARRIDSPMRPIALGLLRVET